jgi:2-dehydro-3-deoxygalactonokinase
VDDGRVGATARRPVGVRDTVLTEGPRPVLAAVRETVDEVCRAGRVDEADLIVAAGMLTSEVGLEAVPHVPAPAGLDELARGVLVRRLPEVSGRPIHLIPGVRTPAREGPDGWAEADIMRGEECETFGALARLPATSPAQTRAFLWPGSHTKLVEVDDSGRIVRSYTTLAGELMQAMARHTLLAASLPGELPDDPDRDAVEAGVRLAEKEGLGRAAFLVRVAALTEALGPSERASFWLGAVVGEDVDRLARHPILAGGCPVWVGGRQPLRALYADRLARRHGGPVALLDDAACEAASALGALAAARRCRELGGG